MSSANFEFENQEFLKARYEDKTWYTVRKHMCLECGKEYYTICNFRKYCSDACGAAAKEKALFLSTRAQRISVKTVQWMVHKYLDLAGFGYNTAEGAVQTETAILGLQMLMSWVPAIVAALSILVVWFYPLTKKKMEGVQAELAVKRGA